MSETLFFFIFIAHSLTIFNCIAASKYSQKPLHSLSLLMIMLGMLDRGWVYMLTVAGFAVYMHVIVLSASPAVLSM
jgi:hypothetical protein